MSLESTPAAPSPADAAAAIAAEAAKAATAAAQATAAAATAATAAAAAATAAGTPDATAAAKKGGIYPTPQAATEAVQKSFSTWSAQVTQRGFEFSMAVIAANWAVFGTKLWNNTYATASVAVVLFGLLCTLTGTWWMSELLLQRIEYAEGKPAQWAAELENTRGRKDPWPFTSKIEDLGSALRLLKTGVPIIGGVLFLWALFGP